MTLEDKLSKWTGPSSNSEQEKQERTERMIREAIKAHSPFADCALEVYTKGSYANNTNVRSDSDVDIAVECTECIFYKELKPSPLSKGKPYEGIWTPVKLRSELVNALKARFANQVDATGTTAIAINSGSARVDADIVPCFTYHCYIGSAVRKGTMIFKTNEEKIVNYPAQQLKYGRAKNERTRHTYKKGVRLLKRIENEMASKGTFRELPSFFMECLAFNCPDSIYIDSSTWTERLQKMLLYIWQELEGREPSSDSERWVEANNCFYLFHQGQKWKRQDGHDFAAAAWNYVGFK